ncbi:MAG: protein kinase [Prevotella sp.]|nr:protein kinase [Prevotella sp.]
MSTLRTSNASPADGSPNVENTFHIEPAGDDTTLRPALDSTDHSAAMDMTMRTMGHDEPDTQDVSGEFFVLKGVKYKNKQCLSENSGEAQVYLVERDGEEYVLKIYYPTFNVNKKMLKTIYNFKFEMVVSLLDYGKVYVDGKSRNYELMEYLRGGTLTDYHLNGDINKFRRIALQAAAALAYCHSNNILHKDVKPSNLFFRDKEHTELVLGDFGISSMLENDGKLHQTTQARTPIYAAPEMYSDVIDGVVEVTPAADFYSLGVTLMYVWLGENPMSSNERVMMRQKSEGRLPRMNELPERVKMIVQGMTVVNPLNRWGYDQVEKWFEGESPKVDLSSPFLKYKSFIVDPDRNLVADNIHELVPMLLENEKLAIGYLYNGRISSWLEQCGNDKLSTIVKDIVVNKYPVDQHAGLMAAVYMMEPTYPYRDIKGNLCDDVHSVAISLLSYIKEYGLLLVNPNDTLYQYLESHTKCNIDRLRSYFNQTEHFDAKVAVMRLVFEIDPEIPLLSRYPSSSLKDIVRTFGKEQLNEDEWHSLTDGRLLSWMYSHEDKMACESLRILTRNQPYSETLAYKVLYNLDRNAAYDLRSANTPQKVGELLNERMKNLEHADEDEFARQMSDIINLDDRFSYFAQMHGWAEVQNEANRCFDFNSEENRERLGAYDAKTAVYRFCRILGVTPAYVLPDGTELTDGRNIHSHDYAQIRNEMRNGSFTQWLSVFYHEDPFADFTEEYAYEHSLEDWLNELGRIDSHQTYYKRFVDAREETSNRIQNVRSGWERAKGKEKVWRMVFYGLSALWILLMLFIGVKDRTFLLGHSFISIGLPLGGMTGIIIATRAYFRGYDFFFSFLWGLAGAFSAFIPIIILKYMDQSHPSLFNITVIAITLVYMLICHLTDFRGDQKADNKLISEVLDNDIKSTLLEPLYYTFKTKSYKFKGSKFGLLDDVTDQVRSISGESVLHYVLWSILALIFVLDFIIFSPSLMNVSNPNVDNFSFKPSELMQKIEKDVE